MNNYAIFSPFGDSADDKSQTPSFQEVRADVMAAELRELRGKLARHEAAYSRLSFSGNDMPQGYCYLLSFKECAREAIARREGTAIRMARWLELLRSSDQVSQVGVSMKQHAGGLWHLTLGGSRARRPEEWLAWWISPKCPFGDLADMTLGGDGGSLLEEERADEDDWRQEAYHHGVYGVGSGFTGEESEYYSDGDDGDYDDGPGILIPTEIPRPTLERVQYFCRMLSLICEAPAHWCPHGIEMYDAETVKSCVDCMSCCMRMDITPACVPRYDLYGDEEVEPDETEISALEPVHVVEYGVAAEINASVVDGGCWTLIAGPVDGMQGVGSVTMRDLRENASTPDATRLLVIAPEHPCAHEARPYHVRYPENNEELAVSVTARHIWTCMPDGLLVGMQRRGRGAGGSARARLPAQQGFNGSCDGCGRFGHVVRQCPAGVPAYFGAPAAPAYGARRPSRGQGARSEPVGRALMRVESPALLNNARVIPRSGNRGPPRPSGSTGRGGDVFTIKKTEVVLAQVLAPAVGSPILANIPLLPSAFPWLNNVSKNWSRYRFVAAVARFVSCQPTTSMGTVYLAYDYSRDLSGPDHDYAGLDASVLMNLERAVEASVWQTTPRPSTAYDSRRRKDPWFSVSAAFQASDDDAVLVYGYQGSLPPATVLGSIEIEYHLELVQPTVQRTVVPVVPVLGLDELLQDTQRALGEDPDAGGVDHGTPVRDGGELVRVLRGVQILVNLTDALFNPDVAVGFANAQAVFQPLVGNLFDLSQRDKIHLNWTTRGGHTDAARRFNDLIRMQNEMRVKLAALETEHGAEDDDTEDSNLDSVADAVTRRITEEARAKGGLLQMFGTSRSSGV